MKFNLALREIGSGMEKGTWLPGVPRSLAQSLDLIRLSLRVRVSKSGCLPFLLYAALLPNSRWEAHIHSGIFNRTSKLRTQFGVMCFLSPPLRGNSSAKGAYIPTPGRGITPINIGVCH
ncbi:hypothetical protein TNCV_1377081 [Trichonephila clavipes]|nr:hypothetical protein TNCV_1377081 [Trichonephila clavipes]